jgi:hypothetical protein
MNIKPALAAALGMFAMLAVGGANTSLAASNDGGPFSHTPWLYDNAGSTAPDYARAVTPRKLKNGQPAWNAYNSYGRGYDSPRATSRPSQTWDPYGLRWDGGN